MQQHFTKWHKNNWFFSNYINDIILKGRTNIQREMIALWEDQSIYAINICDVFNNNTDYYAKKLSSNDLHKGISNEDDTTL